MDDDNLSIVFAVIVLITPRAIKFVPCEKRCEEGQITLEFYQLSNFSFVGYQKVILT